MKMEERFQNNSVRFSLIVNDYLTCHDDLLPNIVCHNYYVFCEVVNLVKTWFYVNVIKLLHIEK